MKKDTTYAAIITLLYFVVSLVGILHHELWLDESQHWLLARDSDSFADLMYNLRFEGHPVLWDSLLFLVSRFTHNPLGMQFLHILIATATAFVFLSRAPFSRTFRTLFVFGYFMIFEYSLISRNYILGIFFLFLACSLFKDRQRKFWILCLYLAIASNVHLIFSVVCCGIFAVLLYEKFRNGDIRTSGAGIFVFGIGLAINVALIAMTQSDWLFETVKDVPLREKFSAGYISLFKGIMTIPDFSTMHFWNTNILVSLSRPTAVLLGLLAYALPLFLLRSKMVLGYVYLTLAGLQVFFFVTQRSAVRFDGMAYMVLVIGLWVEQYLPQDEVPEAFLKRKKWVLYSILSIQMLTGVLAYTFDYLYPFTAAKNVASFLKHKKPENGNVVTVTCDGTMLSPYLQKKIYFLSEKSEHSYCDWGSAKGIFQKDSIRAMLTSYVNEKGTAIFVSGYAFTDSKSLGSWQALNEMVKVKLLAEYNDNIIRNSGFSIYEISPIKQH
ncbi:hypothetical protein [Flavobacterium pallidum]|uniref:Glycosyltransferase RgtA/B/C/D-like domain-containing protein n=1 Tax=Flavobacterium pallidum TaxID=2172098 RepID=A0A2S1SG25_9FLAO|nr:hypothetical protein [Flavobacterium pallidum]AWI25364.1 hypothetical protein HYN49_05315 [Flavobacterium pallidum]